MFNNILRDRGLRYWLPSYFMQALKTSLSKTSIDETIHVMFLICDHYEPRHKATRSNQDAERVATWVREYPVFAQKCKEEFGHYPLHSWFYPPHHGYEHIDQINRLVYEGYGG